MRARRIGLFATAAMLVGVLSACGSSQGSSSTTRATAASTTTTSASTTTSLAVIPTTPTTIPVADEVGSSTTDQTVNMPASSLDPTKLPLGTDMTSTSPQVGSLDRCGGSPPDVNGATIPPWVDTAAKTWNATEKVAVAGDVTWTTDFTAAQQGSSEVFTGNGLPPRSGTFPVAASDPAHAYNPDPTAVFTHQIKLSVPYNPSTNASATCESGVVGIAINGIPILDAFDGTGNDAFAVEVLDTCHGHPNTFVGYHYHSLSPCLLSTYDKAHTTQVGWALDGYGIYVGYNAKGQLLTDSDLDGCHGRTSVVPWHGKMVDIYHYDMTTEFPYSVGCFRGTPSSFAGLTVSGTTGPPGRP